MRTQTTSKTERNGTSNNNREFSGQQLKQAESGIAMVEVLLGLAIAAGINATVWAVAGILGVIFDWFD